LKIIDKGYDKSDKLLMGIAATCGRLKRSRRSGSRWPSSTPAEPQPPRGPARHDSIIAVFSRPARRRQPAESGPCSSGSSREACLSSSKGWPRGAWAEPTRTRAGRVPRTRSSRRQATLTFARSGAEGVATESLIVVSSCRYRFARLANKVQHAVCLEYTRAFSESRVDLHAWCVRRVFLNLSGIWLASGLTLWHVCRSPAMRISFGRTASDEIAQVGCYTFHRSIAIPLSEQSIAIGTEYSNRPVQFSSVPIALTSSRGCSANSRPLTD
jgi:hypothetical protein